MDLKIATVVNVLSSGGLCYLSYLISKKNMQLEDLGSTDVFTPSSLVKELRQPNFLNNLKKNPESPDEYLLNAFLEGYVECDSPLVSKIDGKTRLVYVRSYKTDIRSNDSLVELKGETTESPRNVEVDAPLYFTLKDPSTNHYCVIHRNLDVETSEVLDRIAKKRTLKKLNFFEQVLVQLGRVAELLNFLTRSLFTIRGITVGWTETELGIAVGSALTTYGQIIYNSKENSLKIDSPLYFLQEKASILRKIRDSKTSLYVFAFILLIPFAFSTYYLATRGVARYRASNKKKEDEQINEADNVKFGPLEDDYKCIVCLERPRNVILKPCMHFSLCRQCYGNLQKNSCPICKKEVADTVAIFFS